MLATTTDLCDQHNDAIHVAAPLFRDFGGRRHFGGPISTVQVYEDNVLMRAALEQPGNGRVLVVDGGGSLRCALLGDKIGVIAQSNGWAGIVVNGAVRDADALGAIDLGLKALATCPRRSGKKGGGARDVPVTFAGVTFVPGHWLVADSDGIVVTAIGLE